MRKELRERSWGRGRDLRQGRGGLQGLGTAGQKKSGGQPRSQGRVGRARRPGRSISPSLELGLGAGTEKGASEHPGNFAGGGGVPPPGLSPWPAARKAPDCLLGRGGRRGMSEAGLRSERQPRRAALPGASKNLPVPHRSEAARGSRARGRPSRASPHRGWEASSGQLEGPSGSPGEH